MRELRGDGRPECVEKKKVVPMWEKKLRRPYPGILEKERKKKPTSRRIQTGKFLTANERRSGPT